jgi:2,4-dienoyl-CoA reductase-like NADH-dependent reductase (Old Yellow Enzyme family)
MAELDDFERTLFSSYRSDKLTLKSRVVMAPMTRAHAANGLLTQDNAAYYGRRAEAGVGLIITEGTWIDHPVASDRQNIPRFYGTDALAGWKLVLDAVHNAGGKIMPQLWHIGAAVDRSRGWNSELPPASPSGLAAREGKLVADSYAPMTQADIDSVINAYARAAELAYNSGFDGVELHAAHGYLIDQFFWHETNKRTDRYNGNISERTRFCAEVIGEMRRRVPLDFPIGLRISQWKSLDYNASLVQSPQELEDFLNPLVQAGVDIFHCSTRRYWQQAFSSDPTTLAGWAKKITGKTTIAVGSVGLDQTHESTLNEQRIGGYTARFAPIGKLVELLDKGEFDLIAVGRALLVDHEWTTKIREGRWDEIKPYTTAVRNIMY